ncbi:hypothetical protein [Acinetobacter sp.]|uniref:hypothetical protein n=1 Tax=Acinetobacter sp. TaxID=472 RepID=UPI00388EF241
MSKQLITISTVQAALLRAIESDQWAQQHDDAEALGHLRDFLESQNTKNMFYIHLLASQQGCSPNVKRDDNENLDVKTVAQLYSMAIDGGPAASISSAIFRICTLRGSAMYELNYNSSRAQRLYVRRCRGELRGEVNEDNFSINRNVTGVTREPRSVTSFLKKVWNKI